MEKILKRFAIILVVIFAVTPSFAHAAKLNLAPQSGVINAGSDFTVNVYVSSTDQAMNGVSGEITFPTDLVNVLSISKSGSIIDVWAQDPDFSNTKGTINFEGVALSPGFTGSNGKVVAITFHAKAVGIANIKFSNGSVLANDGNGTDILDGLGNSQFKITAPLAPLPSVPVIATSSPVSTLNTPSIDYYKARINAGDSIVIKGSSQYPNSKILVSLQYNDESANSYTILTDKIGDYVFAETSGAKQGIYKIWVQSLADDGSTSAPSTIDTILVGSFYNITIDQFQINILLLILILLILIYLIRGAFVRRHRTKREFSDVIMSADRLANVKLNNFTKYIEKQIDILESDTKFNRINDYEEMIENFKKSITDYKKSLEKKSKE
jgi:hypothetical protein